MFKRQLKPGRDNNQRLKLTLSSYGISRRWAAKYLLVNLSTVDRWLQPKTRGGKKNASYRAMPDSALKLFEYRIQDDEITKLGMFQNPPDPETLID